MNKLKITTIASILALSALASTSTSALTISGIDPAPSATASYAAKIDFVFGDEMVPGRVERLDRLDAHAADAAAQAYFDFDAIVSLGTLTLAGAAFVAVGVAAGRRRKAERDLTPSAAATGWRALVLEGLERDLARCVRGLRRAA